jgi:hypothetical protein
MVPYKAGAKGQVAFRESAPNAEQEFFIAPVMDTLLGRFSRPLYPPRQVSSA